MTTYVADHETGKPLCLECGGGACHGGYICEAEHCQCWCRTDEAARERRAAELDDRPEPALANLARDIEAEARPDVDALMAERFGRPTRSRA